MGHYNVCNANCKVMKVFLRHFWGMNTDQGNMAITKKASRLVHSINREKNIPRKRQAMEKYFWSYEAMVNHEMYPEAMYAEVAAYVFEYAVYIGRFSGINRMDCEIIWKKIIGDEIWEFTKNSFLSSRK